jgi:PAS domain S-box-containing protein
MDERSDPGFLARAERDRWIAMVRSLQDGLIVLDRDGIVVEVNDRWTEILGFTSGEAVGQGPPFPWWPDAPDDRAQIQRAVDQVVGRGEPGEFDVRYRRKDGVLVPVILSATPLVDPVDGQRTGSVATIKDVTERRRAEVEREDLLRRLSKESDRRSAFLASLQDGFLASNLEGAIEDVNERFCTIVGRSRDELV